MENMWSVTSRQKIPWVTTPCFPYSLCSRTLSSLLSPWACLILSTVVFHKLVLGNQQGIDYQQSSMKITIVRSKKRVLLLIVLTRFVSFAIGLSLSQRESLKQMMYNVIMAKESCSTPEILSISLSKNIKYTVTCDGHSLMTKTELHYNSWIDDPRAR